MHALPLRAPRASAVLTLAAAALLGLTACTPDATPPGDAARTTPPTPTHVAASPSPTPTADARLSAPASARVAPTCDDIMDPASGKTVVAIVPPQGADPAPPPAVLARGVTCVMGEGSDQFYAWSPATRAEWDAEVATLTGPGSGWFTEEGARGTYLTYKIDGRYSQTYLFTGDAVILAPTRAATDLVIGPPVA